MVRLKPDSTRIRLEPDSSERQPECHVESGFSRTDASDASAGSAADYRSAPDDRDLLRHLSQRAAEDRRSRARLPSTSPTRPRTPTRGRRSIRKLRTGMMPPAGAPRPDAAVRQAVVSSLEATLDRAARRVAESRPPARAPAESRRVRQRDSRSARARRRRHGLLPPDDSSAGFDNNADVLGVSPVLLESYLSAAERISALAIGDPRTPPVGVGPSRAAGRVAGSPRRGASARHGRRPARFPTTLPLDGEYQFQVRLFRTNLGTMRGLEYPHQLEISVDGERVHLAVVRRRRGDRRLERQPDDDRRCRRRPLHRARPLKAGPRRIGVAFLEKTHALNTRRLQTYVRSSSDTIDFSGLSAHRRGHPDRPVQSDRPGRHAQPAPDLHLPAEDAGATRTHCARQILATLARRAYRGDVTRGRPGTRCRTSSSAGDATAAASRAASIWRCAACCQPEVHLPGRARSGGRRAGQRLRVSDLELASRLSFFLWSSIPDDELLDAAARKTLRTPAVLEQQVRRMLADPSRRRSSTTSSASGCSCAT